MKMNSQKLRILSKSENKDVLGLINSRFGVEKIPGILIRRGEERIFLFQGSFSEKEIQELECTVYIERAGVYIGKVIEFKDGRRNIRLSIEGSQIFADQIEKNIVELDDGQVEEWMKGRELLIPADGEDGRGFVVMKSKKTGDFLGCGQASAEKITNFIPKNRRLKEKQIS